MKAYLYEEQEQKMEPIDEHKLATADEKPSPADAPKQGLYVVNYKTLIKPTLIALVILAIFILALCLL